jgi:aminopeptidase N
MRRRRWLGAAALLAAAASCSGPGVRTESAASVTTGPTPPTTAPGPAATGTEPGGTPSTGPPAPLPPATAGEPSPTVPPSTLAPLPPGDPARPSTSSGDALFPELGSADLDVLAYDVRLAYDVDTERIDATVTITAVTRRPVDAVALDAGDLTVGSVTVDEAPAAFEHAGVELVIRPGTTVEPGTPTAFTIEYWDDRHAEDAGFGTGAGWYPVPGGAYVLNEPFGSRQWLPSNDHPSDKATWRFELTVGDGLAAVANGELVEQRPAADGTTWVWEQREPMATYLVQLLIGDYTLLDGGVVGDTPITNVALREDAARVQPYVDLTADQLDFFEPLFGPYPLERYGLAFAPSRPGLAMETQGRSLFSRFDIRTPPDHDAQLFTAHELAHQWFGNAVTPATWSDLWLAESFATYGQWLWLDHIGAADVETLAALALEVRQEPTEPTGAPSAGRLFAFERYDGGAVVVHALRRELGDDTFFGLLRQWVDRHRGTSRTTADFVALAEELAGRDLGAFFEAWLDAPSLPPELPS